LLTEVDTADHTAAAPLIDNSLPDQVRTMTSRLDHEDRRALGLWGLMHVVLFMLVYAVAWTTSGTSAHKPLLGGLQQWDSVLLSEIAEHGYYGPGSTPHNAAFFPGYPLALALVHLLVRNWIASGLLVSLAAGCFVVVGITRLAGSSRAALYLLTAPVAVFLTVGYSESLFLAFAIPAWSAGRAGRWLRCGVFASLAAFTRPDGIFLLVALAVMALTFPLGGTRSIAVQGHVRTRLSALSAVALGLIGPLIYELYLYAHTHRWSAWADAQEAGWAMHYVGPWQALKTSYWGAFEHPFGAEFGFMEQLEIVCIAVLLAATIGFAVRRRWAEAAYCAMAVFGVGTQTWYQAAPRTLLVIFPVWIALAQYARTRPWASATYLALSGSLATLIGVLYLAGQWAG
jgi:hypothetical protein